VASPFAANLKLNYVCLKPFGLQMFLAWIIQALRAASFRMRLPLPRFEATLLNEV
jgi:hypothetical protein